MKIIFFLILFPVALFALIEEPNYNFSLDQFDSIMPGTKKEVVEQKFGKGSLLKKNPETIKYLLKHQRYVFPVIVQYDETGTTQDFYAKLPSYFFHSVFHQAIITRFGKQNQYIKGTRNALYIWDNIKGNKIIYSGSCTITCFPEFYTVIPLKQSLTPLLNSFSIVEKTTGIL